MVFGTKNDILFFQFETREMGQVFVGRRVSMCSFVVANRSVHTFCTPPPACSPNKYLERKKEKYADRDSVFVCMCVCGSYGV